MRKRLVLPLEPGVAPKIGGKVRKSKIKVKRGPALTRKVQNKQKYKINKALKHPAKIRCITLVKIIIFE